MGKKDYILIVALLIVIIILIYFYAIKKDLQASNECKIKNNDADGYLLKICNYIKKSNISVSPADPENYSIEKIEEENRGGKEIIIVRLNCCYMGDIAYIDKETGEIIELSIGDI